VAVSVDLHASFSANSRLGAPTFARRTSQQIHPISTQ
jgi:hypothetical protein